MAPVPPTACSGVTFNCEVSALSKPAVCELGAAAAALLLPWAPETALATSPRLKPAANTGLAATLSRQDRAKPREIFIKTTSECRS